MKNGFFNIFCLYYLEYAECSRIISLIPRTKIYKVKTRHLISWPFVLTTVQNCFCIVYTFAIGCNLYLCSQVCNLPFYQSNSFKQFIAFWFFKMQNYFSISNLMGKMFFVVPYIYYNSCTWFCIEISSMRGETSRWYWTERWRYGGEMVQRLSMFPYYIKKTW